MKLKILKFIHILKDSNIRISTSEIIDFFTIISDIDIFNIVDLYMALMSCLIKNKDDISTFNKIFNLYFMNNRIENDDINEDKFEDLISDFKNNIDDEIFEDLKKDNHKMDDWSSLSYKDYDKEELFKEVYKQGSIESLYDIINDIIDKIDIKDVQFSNIDNVCENIMYKNNLEKIKTQSKKEVTFKQKQDLDEKHQQIKEYIKSRLEKKAIGEYGESVIKDMIDKDDVTDLMDMDISELNIEDYEKIENVIRRMKKKINTYKTFKFKRSKKGYIDIKNTIKKSIKYGNTCSELTYKNKKNNRAKLVILCDISGSVQEYVGFMLQITLLIRNNFSKIKTFVFVDRVKEITDDILGKNIYETIDLINSIHGLGYSTRYADVFDEFSQLDIFDNKTVLIVLGDAQNTSKNIGDEYLENISNKCKSIIWLNPLEQKYWYDNSDLIHYEKHCKNIFCCNTLRDLEYFIKHISKI